MYGGFILFCICLKAIQLILDSLNRKKKKNGQSASQSKLRTEMICKPCKEAVLVECYPFLETRDPDNYQLLHNSDLDPDLNMLTSNSMSLSRCNYMSSRQYNNIFPDISNYKSFSFFRLNIRSSKKHLVDLQVRILIRPQYILLSHWFI